MRWVREVPLGGAGNLPSLPDRKVLDPVHSGAGDPNRHVALSSGRDPVAHAWQTDAPTDAFF